MQKKLRQTIIDHDPATGEVVGATQVFLRSVEVEGKSEALEPAAEPLKVEEVPKIWGGTSDAHAAKLQETESVLAAEREARKTEKEEAAAKIKELEDALAEKTKDFNAAAARLVAVVKAANGQ